MTAELQNPTQLASRWTSRQGWWALAWVLVGSLLIRIPFFTSKVVVADSMNYYVAVVRDWVAHPPGYIGYNILGMGMRLVTGDVGLGFVLLSLMAAMAGVIAIFLLSRELGFSIPTAICAAVVYSLSINTLYFSLIALNHTLEGLMVGLIALFGWRAIRDRSFRDGLIATIIFALAGAIRPTTTAMLGVLWLLIAWRSTARWWQFFSLAVVAAVLVMPWSMANKHFLAKTSWGSTYDLQVMMPTQYDYAGVSVATGSQPQIAAAPSFHMPGFEMLAWVEKQVGHKILPHNDNWPEPSLRRATILAATQAGKCAYWLLLSVPSLACALALGLLKPRTRFVPPGAIVFFAAWIIPNLLFSVFGHLGSLGYVQVILPALVIITCARVFAGSGEGRPAKAAVALLMVPVVASVLIFCFARPTHSGTSTGRTADLLLLQFTGPAIWQHWSTSRASTEPDFHQMSPEMRSAATDAEILNVAEKYFDKPPKR